MINLPYRTFSQAQQTLANIEPVDYFLAKELTPALLTYAEKNEVSHFSQQQITTLFHLLIYLNQALQAGHTCLPLKNCVHIRLGFECDQDGVISKQGFTFGELTELDTLLSELLVSPTDNNLVVYHNGCLYLRRYYLFEQELTAQLSQRISTIEHYTHQQIKLVIAQLFPEDEQLTEPEIDWQKVAVVNAINKNFSVIAGGPGTGKTYTVTKLLAALVMLQKNAQGIEACQQTRYALVAPTGKAAQRLSESLKNAVQQFQGNIEQDILACIPTSSQTIHRLLGYLPNQPNFKHHQDNLLPLDFILVDEVSMVDLPLLTRLFRALPEHCKVVLLGDADQLPSVAVGSVLADIAPRPHPGFSKQAVSYIEDIIAVKLPKEKIAKANTTINADYLTFLEKSRRFDGQGGIGLLAKAVINGEAATSWQLLKQAEFAKDDLALLPKQQLSLITGSLPNFIETCIKHYYQALFQCETPQQAFALFAKFRILTATRKGQTGVETINEQVLQYFINLGLIHKNTTLFHAMPIMVTENHHKLGVYNGDIGFIWRDSQGQLMAVFEEMPEDTLEDSNEGNHEGMHKNIHQNSEQGIRWLLPTRLPNFEPVYAMTIHKTQGSEFEQVMMLLPDNADNQLLSRELLYTGITRAKKHISIASSASVWSHGVERQVNRYSQLSVVNH